MATQRSMPDLKAQRRGRVSTSCLECKRLKRKCDRQWPCLHCLARKVPHLCQYDDSQPKMGPTPPAKKRREESDHGLQIISTSLSSQTEDATIQYPSGHLGTVLKSLAYIESDIFTSIDQSAPVYQVLRPQPEIQEALRTLPPRPYVDILVQAFFESVNYHYDSIHQPTFMKLYVDWWSRRRLPAHSFMTPDIAFAGLVLQMCSNACQYASPEVIEKLELDLGESADALGLSYYNAACRLATAVPPGEGGLAHVQQFFLGACWQKTQAEITKSWHLLGSAFREAQEIGMHLDSPSQLENKQHEKELRRRVWLLLCIWDKSMSVFFGRPRLMSGENTVPLPNPRFDSTTTGVEVFPAALAMIHEYQIWAYIEGLKSSSSWKTLTSKLNFCIEWMSSLPEIFRLDRPHSLCEKDSFVIKFRRLKLHCMGYMARLVILRGYLIESGAAVSAAVLDETNSDCEGENPTDMTILAVDTAIDLIFAGRRLFQICYPNTAKYFMVSFCSFDTASLLCSALLRDKDKTRIRKRDEVVEAIGCAVYICNQLRAITRMGEATWAVLTGLVSQLDLQQKELQLLNITSTSGETLGPASQQNDEDFVDAAVISQRHTEKAAGSIGGSGFSPLLGIDIEEHYNFDSEPNFEWFITSSFDWSTTHNGIGQDLDTDT
ncbi:fungal-specific transcription factor domain-containing protein [Xylariales sp. PMI_506]|nr:fungal-specific transcription factor domain-containing protein [Xylariales sp. PMI_506]